MADRLPNIDPTEADARGADLAAKRALFDEASTLLDDKGVFMLAVRAVRIKWFGALMDAKDRDTKNDLTSKLQVLMAIPEEIQRFVNDYKMAQDRLKNARRN